MPSPVRNWPLKSMVHVAFDSVMGVNVDGAARGVVVRRVRGVINPARVSRPHTADRLGQSVAGSRQGIEAPPAMQVRRPLAKSVTHVPGLKCYLCTWTEPAAHGARRLMAQEGSWHRA